MQTVINSSQDFLIKTHIPDTGWGYTGSAEQAYPEPTCYSLLALSYTSFQPTKTISWLAGLVNADGQLYLPQDDMPNWATSLLVITLTRLNQLPEVRAASVDWLLKWRSKHLEANTVVDLNGNLIGWPWISDTFSWVHPTSFAILALKMAGQKNHERVKEGELLLLDRVCYQGGWNFGNPAVLNQPIDPAVVDTAIALFALQDLPDAQTDVEKGLAILESDAPKFPSALSLSLSILCLNIYNRPVDKLVDLLLKRQETDGSWRQMVWWTALAVMALRAADGGENAFKI